MRVELDRDASSRCLVAGSHHFEEMLPLQEHRQDEEPILSDATLPDLAVVVMRLLLLGEPSGEGSAYGRHYGEFGG